VTAPRTGVGNRLLAALPPADLGLLTPYFKKVSFAPDTVLVRSGDEAAAAAALPPERPYPLPAEVTATIGASPEIPVRRAGDGC